MDLENKMIKKKIINFAFIVHRTLLTYRFYFYALRLIVIYRFFSVFMGSWVSSKQH